MSATTEPKRVSKHAPSGGKHLPKPYGILLVGGMIFVVAWCVWTFWFAAALPS